MRSKQYYQRLTDSITDELIRQEEKKTFENLSTNKEWYFKFARTISKLTKAVWEGLSSDIIEGRLIQCAAIIFAWIEYMDSDVGAQT